MTLAALDLGSNSFGLLVARVEADGRVARLGSYKRILRLGVTVESYRTIVPEAFERALDAVGVMVGYARSFSASRILAVGTGALREADNGASFVHAVRERFGIEASILSGEDEARLSYRGARAGLAELPRRVAVVDLGGSSVEVAVGSTETPEFAITLPLGFLRVGSALGVSARNFALVREHVLRCAADGAHKLRELSPEAWVLSGGTARTLGRAAGWGGAETRPRERAEIDPWIARLSNAGASELRELGVDPARFDSIAGGACVLGALLDVFGVPAVRVSPFGLRQGVILEHHARGEPGSRGSHSRPHSRTDGTDYGASGADACLPSR